MLPALSNDDEQVRAAASRVNNSLMEYILSLPDENSKPDDAILSQLSLSKESSSVERRESTAPSHIPRPSIDSQTLAKPALAPSQTNPQAVQPEAPRETWTLDYETTINALTLHFLNENEATRVAALQWLIMLHRKSPPARKVRAVHDI
jgi:hypothetical protein